MSTFTDAKIHKTRFETLGFAKLGNTWNLLDLTADFRPCGFSVIGPNYASKTELLADLENQASFRLG